MIRHKVHVTENDMNYDMIIGQDLLEELGIDLKFSTKTIVWQHREIPMKDRKCTLHNLYHVDKPEPLAVILPPSRLNSVCLYECSYSPK